jgi:branched-chain amino acid transport system permease protein
MRRSESKAGAFPPAFLAFSCLALLFLAPVISWYLRNPYILSLATRAAALACAAVSLQFVVGYAGLYSFGHAAFLGIGAYVLLTLARFGLDETALSLPAAMAAAGAFAAITGWFALRTSGVTFIMITLAFGQMAYFVAQSLNVFGGDDGTPLDRRPPLFTTGVLDNTLAWHALVLTLLAGVLLLQHLLAASRFGRAVRAARESAARAAASGFDVRLTRLIAYTLSGAACGAAGWMLAAQAQFVSPALLEWRNSGELLVMVILGGVVTAGGAALAAVLLTGAEEGLAAFTEHWRLLLGPALVLVVLARRA